MANHKGEQMAETHFRKKAIFVTPAVPTTKTVLSQIRTEDNNFERNYAKLINIRLSRNNKNGLQFKFEKTKIVISNWFLRVTEHFIAHFFCFNAEISNLIITHFW